MYIQGTLFIHALNVATSRFIPVYTRNTNTCESAFTNVEVYPCVYREHKKKVTYKIITVRFIPVYTGNAKTTHLDDTCSSVYPCVYRERSANSIAVHQQYGLSLCIQGTLCYQTHCQMSTRFIPVYTGNAPLIIEIGRQASGLSLCIQGTLQSF